MADLQGQSPDRGVYLLWLYLPRPSSITIGKLGTFSFGAGVYAYCGSAQKNLAARLKRHRRLEKIWHWHIDYFRAEALYLGEVVLRGCPKEGECLLVKEVLRIPGSYYPVSGLGSSDCRCGAHLLKVPLGAPPPK